MNSSLQTCSRCVMDSSDPDIIFDNQGVCNYCHHTEKLMATLPTSDAEAGERLAHTVDTIKRYGRGKEYDCLLGISGGVDSSYLAHLAKELELRPLVVHFDNGWNSELAVENINKIIDKLGFDLFTYVIDWDEFKDLQRSFLEASVIDLEMLTDHAIGAAVYSIARKNGIRFILSGENIATETGMPPSWVWNKQDLTNIKAIQKRFGTTKIRSFPTFSMLQWAVNTYFKRFEFVCLLNQLRYSKNRAVEILSSELGWRYYGGKHYESIFTKFYQAYILPRKFGVDKRMVHLSSLIRNNEITRQAALGELEKPLYDELELQNDKKYVIKKLGFTEQEFDYIMKMPARSHRDYPSDEKFLHLLFSIRNFLKKFS